MFNSEDQVAVSITEEVDGASDSESEFSDEQTGIESSTHPNNPKVCGFFAIAAGPSLTLVFLCSLLLILLVYRNSCGLYSINDS